ncbi:Transcription factor MYB98 [Linum grandiflorum]
MEHKNEGFVVSSQQLFMSENKYTMKQYQYHQHQDHEFLYDLPPPSPPRPEEEEKFHGVQNRWLSNQVFGGVLHTGSNFDSFDAFPYGSYSSLNMDSCLDQYECKPFADINGYMNFHNNYFERNHHHHLQGHGIENEMVGSSNHNDQMQEDEIKPAAASLKSSVTKKTWIKGRKKNSVVKGQWTVDEDRLLVQLVEEYGIRKWSHIAQMLPGRIGKQCRERWHNHLRPDIKKDTWTEEEDKVLIQSHTEIGNKWAEIAKKLPGRTENSIKNHWNATKRRQYSKRKCRSKYPRGSILQDYIKSLNLDSGSNSNLLSKRSALSSGKNNTNNNITSSFGVSAAPLLDIGHDDQGHHHQQHDLEEFSENDRLVPTFDYSNEEVPGFGFDDKNFQHGCNLDSLLDGLPGCASIFDGKSFGELDVPTEDQHTSTVALFKENFEVKKELDLVEMMNVTKKLGFF